MIKQATTHREYLPNNKYTILLLLMSSLINISKGLTNLLSINNNLYYTIPIIVSSFIVFSSRNNIITQFSVPSPYENQEYIVDNIRSNLNTGFFY